MAAPALPIGKGYTAAQWEAWLNANVKGTVASSVTYQGTQLKGKTWGQVYQVIYAYGLTKGVTAPDDAAAATEEYIVLDSIGADTASLAQGVANATSDTATGVSTASYVPSWASGLTSLLGALTSANLWIRVAKVIVGGTLLIVGLVHITGAGGAAADIARKVPVPI